MQGAYLIWSNEHRAWWRPDRLGYTTEFSEAGFYTREEALAVCTAPAMIRDGIPQELPVRAEDARPLFFD